MITIRNILIVAAKNAVNAVLTNAALMAKFPTVFNIHTKDGWFNLAYAVGSVVLAREALVWIPELLRWSRTNAEPSQP